MARLAVGTGWTLALLILGLGFIFHLALAAQFPLSNDESYYWDWGQKLQLSYYDHPPGIAWVTALSSRMASGLLGVRLLIPFMHGLGAFFLLLCLRHVKPAWRPRDMVLLSAATVLWPGFGLLGVLALPDAGLYPFITAALWLTLRSRDQESLGLNQGLGLGALLGLAGLFKYHALPLGAGLVLTLLMLRRSRLRQDLWFWLGVGTAGLVMTTPVWVWNLQNDWASIRYQTQHGMGDLRWQIEGGLRTLLGFLVFVTPWFALLLFRTLGRLTRDAHALPEGVAAIVLGCSLPLIGLIMGISFFKPVLLHWIMPGFWLLLPALVVLQGEVLARSKRSWILAASLSVVLPSVLARKDFRKSLLSVLDAHAGPLMELTLWPDLNAGLQSVTRPIFQHVPAHCPVDGYLAGQRWYSVAQLHFLNKRMPVISLDRHHPSYYTFRDAAVNWLKCPVTLVIAEKNYQAELFEDVIAVERVVPIPLRSHASQKYLAVSGTLIAPPDRVLEDRTRAAPNK